MANYNKNFYTIGKDRSNTANVTNKVRRYVRKNSQAISDTAMVAGTALTVASGIGIVGALGTTMARGYVKKRAVPLIANLGQSAVGGVGLLATSLGMKLSANKPGPSTLSDKKISNASIKRLIKSYN